MYCTNCGAKLAEGTRFCTSCGSAVVDMSAPAPNAVDSDATIAMPRPQPVQTPAGAQTQPAPSMQPVAYGQQQAYNQPVYAQPQPQRAKTPIAAIVGMVAAVAIILGVGSYFLFTNILAPKQATQSAVEQAATSSSAGQTTSSESATQTQAATPAASSSSSEQTQAASSEKKEQAKDSSTADGVDKDGPGKDEYMLPDSATRAYSKSELEKLSNEELYYARNEIYARHGRKFKNTDLQQHFGSKSWYKGTIEPEAFDETSVFNQIEKDNVQAMRAIEESRNSPYLK